MTTLPQRQQANAAEPRSDPGFTLVGISFCLSGAAALVYQVAWQRILAFHSGVGVYSVAMITAAFMAGLGLGSSLGAGLSVRLSPRRALFGFAGLELGIGLFAACSPWLYYDLWYRHAQAFPVGGWRTALSHFTALVIPTVLMGMSLPFLVRTVVRDVETAGRAVGDFYGINVVGAALGAAVTPWLLIRFLGLRGAIYSGVAANLLAAACAGLFALRRAGCLSEPPAESPGAASRPEGVGECPFVVYVALYALSGFCALSLEILWFRLIDVGVKATSFTFGTVLSIYLLGLASGSLVGARVVNRVRRPLKAFLTVQCLLLLAAGLGYLLLARLPPDLFGYQWFFDYFRERRGFRLGRGWDPGAFWKLYLLFPALLYGLPTFLMGLSFTALQRGVQDDPRTSGRKAGLLQAANIVGCMAGSLVVGLGTLSWMGSTGTVALLSLLGVSFAGVGIVLYGPRRVFVASLAGLVLIALALPGQEGFWRRLHGLVADRALVEEDATGVIALTPQDYGEWWLWINGRSVSQLPFGGIHSLLGALPALIHPHPRDVAVVGLGSGDTAWAAGCRAETERVRVFELCAPQEKLLRRLSGRRRFEKLSLFLADPRFRLDLADGRNVLQREARLYDLIEADALLPETAYSGTVYSQEFFATAARRLKPGGVMCTWAPTRRTLATFASVFPHIVGFRDRQIVVGSLSPIPLDQGAWTRRLASPPVSARLGASVSGEVHSTLRAGGAVDPRELPPIPLNRDLFPRDEFASPEG